MDRNQKLPLLDGCSRIWSKKVLGSLLQAETLLRLCLAKADSQTRLYLSYSSLHQSFYLTNCYCQMSSLTVTHCYCHSFPKLVNNSIARTTPLWPLLELYLSKWQKMRPPAKSCTRLKTTLLWHQLVNVSHQCYSILTNVDAHSLLTRVQFDKKDETGGSAQKEPMNLFQSLGAKQRQRACKRDQPLMSRYIDNIEHHSTHIGIIATFNQFLCQ
jgi:hypothetical protein